ncbi:hypothetical protein NECAME_11318 [Necator americanus]|uniref:Btz domain-containing protein n=1 Tax=Necator americanus TaxID=51031 RepID=W2T7B5_NECAM|nr:hypothetical protein NECAME_11318 [Necator americanus]ETN77061.1 hypothetical protein NECAME_11318 [Necator americanus]
MGPRRDRLSGFRGYYGRDRYERRDRDAGSRRSFVPRSAADGLWTHDKFIELEGDEGSDNDRNTGVEVVVDQSSASSKAKRVVHEVLFARDLTSSMLSSLVEFQNDCLQDDDDA